MRRPNEITLESLSDELILTEDPDRLSRLTALAVKRLITTLNGCPQRCWQTYWLVRGAWAAIGIIITVLLLIMRAAF